MIIRGYLRRLALVACLLPALCVAASAQEDAGPTHLPGGTMLRGTVTAISAEGLTLRDGDGVSYTVAVTPNTRVMRSQQPAKFTDLRVGDGVGAGGVLDEANHTLHAAFLGAVDAEEVRRAQADLGKTYILGRITAVDLDQLRISVHRPDGVTQVIGVDEGTSFRRGGRGEMGASAGNGRTEHAGGERAADAGESITLADVKVGESIAARGALKGKLFVPTELHVFSGEHHRRPADGSAATAGGPQ